MAETRPFPSTSASMVTSPATRCDRAICGYTGGTDDNNRATLTSPPTGRGATGPLPLLARRPRLDESAGVAVFRASPGSAAPLSASAAFRVSFGAARRTWPNAGFLADSSATSSAGALAGPFAEATLLPPLPRAALPYGRTLSLVVAAAGWRTAAEAGSAATLEEFLAPPALGSLASTPALGAGMLAGLLSATVPIPSAETLGA